MARPTEGEEIPWFELGIFKWFNFTQETIKEFSIDPKASTIFRKEVRMKLAQKHVDGTRIFLLNTIPPFQQVLMWSASLVRQP